MAKDKSLELSIHIAGKIDKSLTSALGQAKNSVSGFSKTMGKIGSVGLATMGAITVGAVAGIKNATDAAKEFEAQMGDVVKYVDGLADKNGKISDLLDKDTGRTYKENYGMMKDALMELSTQIPMSVDELTKLAAAAGQSGKGINDLIQYDGKGKIGGFLKDVAMMGTAMDISAEQAGDWGAKWEKAFNMDHSEIMVLADQINYLGANSATTAAEIAQAVNDAASLGQIAGANVSTTAALADAMLATGVSSGKVATSIKRTFTNMSKGTSATKAQKEAWEELGMSADEVAKSMQVDANATLIQVYKAIDAMPKERQVATLSTLFGQWAIEGNAKVVGNLKTFTDALEMVNDPSKYKGSMEREFIIKADTAESIDKMLGNSMHALNIKFGDAFLPVKKQFATMMLDIFDGLDDNMPQLQQISGQLADLASKGVSKLGDAIQKALPYIQKALDYVSTHGDTVVKVLGGMAATFAGMKAAPLIETLLGGGGSLIAGGGGSILSGLGGLFAGGQKAYGMLPGLMSSAQMGVNLATRSSFTQGGMGGPLGGIMNTLTGAYFGVKNSKGLLSPKDNTMWKALLGTATQIEGVQKTGILGSMFGGTGIGTWFGNMGNAINGVKQNPIVSGIGGALGQAGGFVGQGFKGLGQGFGLLGQYAGGAIANSGVGQFVGGIGSAAGGAIGSIAGGVSNIAGALAGPASAVSGLFGGVLNVATTAIGPIAGMFGTLLSGALPVIGVISGIIAVASILYDNLDGVRGIIQQTFGDQGVQVFDKFKSGLDGVIGYIQGLFNGGLSDALSGIREKFIGLFDGDAAVTAGATFDNIVNILQSVLGVIGQIVDFAIGTVKPIITDICNYLVSTVFPIILNTFNSAAPIISEIISNVGSAVMGVAQIIASAFQAALPFIKGLITTILTIGSVAIPAVLSAFNTVWGSISSIVGNLQGIFDGLITFITGVFTGNWSQAWEGVKQIFGNAFDALVELCKAPINAVIALINSAIGGINKLGLKIPDWVPQLGGKEFKVNIPTIPMLAKGGFTSGPSIAGEAGREAVISFDRSVRAQNISTWAKAGEMLGLRDVSEARTLEPVDAGEAMRGDNITFAPQITIQGNADDSVVDDLMDQMQAMFENWYEQRQRRQFRTAY